MIGTVIPSRSFVLLAFSARFSVFRGRNAVVGSEFFAEIKRIVKAEHLGDLVHGNRGNAKQLRRLLHQQIGLILGGRAALALGEKMNKMVLADSAHFCIFLILVPNGVILLHRLESGKQNVM